MGKSSKQKNNEKLLAQQVTELEKLRETMPLDVVRAAEDALLKQSLGICEGALDFAELGFNVDGTVDEGSIPLEWHTLTDEQKARKIRLAKYGCLTSRDVPFGVKAAFQTATAIIKSRTLENVGSRVFNMEVSFFPAPAPLEQDPAAIDADYEVVDLD